MLTVVSVKPTDDYFDIITHGFEVELIKVGNLGQIDFDFTRPIFIFHPRTHDDNPDWLSPEKVEDFMDFEYPKDCYLVFGADYNYHIIEEVEEYQPKLKDARWFKIPTEKSSFKSLHAHQTAAIVLWEYYKRTDKANIEWHSP
jgi:hypothetical protein